MPSIVKKLILSLSLFSFFSVGGQFVKANIRNVIVNLENGAHFRTVESMVNPDECKSDTWYKFDSSSPYGKEAYSLLLSAQAQNKQISFYLSGCTGDYPKISYVYI